MTDQKPLWTPSEERQKATKLYEFIKVIETATDRTFSDYHDFYQWSIDDQKTFWDKFWDFSGVIGEKGSVILEEGEHMRDARYFPKSRLNYAENLLRRQDNGKALIFRDEQGQERFLTFKDVNDQVSQLQQFLKDQGIKKGDRVAGYMPNLPETIIAHLATASLGAIWSSASPDFGAQGLLDRFGQIEPKILITADSYFYNGKVIDCLEKVKDVQPQLKGLRKTVIVRFASHHCENQGDEAIQKSMHRQDCSKDKLAMAEYYDDILSKYSPQKINYERVEFNHPLVIMFSSGTTGKPKCIVHGHGGTLLQHLKEHILHCDVKRDDTVFYFTTCGWMMWNWLITGLAAEATLLLYDGSPFYPDGNVLWDFTSAHHVCYSEPLQNILMR